MYNLLRLLILAAVILMSQASTLYASDIKEKELYTQVNMYALKGNVTWVNYSAGALIPVNTVVVVRKVYGGSTYTLKETGQKLKLKNRKNRSGLTNQQWSEKHFQETQVDLSRFSKLERDAIASGIVKVGMSKDAVIVSRGYPPAHKTPSLNLPQWRYWKTRFNTIVVNFDADNKVSGIRD